MALDYSIIGSRIRKARLEKNITQEELAALLARFNELNKGIVPKLGTIAKIPLLEKYVLADKEV